MVARRGAARAPTETVVVAGVPVQTTVTANPGVVRRWVYATRWRLRCRRHPTVGLGVQWTPRFRAGADEPPDTLQLCVGRRCLVFQIGRATGGRVPMILRRFLAESHVRFAAYNVAADRRKLRAHHGLDVASAMELRRASGMGNASMERMADAHLGIRGMAKSRKVGLGKWFVPTLSKKQVRYACVDAYLSYLLGVRLRHNYEASERDEDRRREVAAVELNDEDNSDYKDYNYAGFDRMVGAIFAMPVWDAQDDCNASFPDDDREEMMELEQEEEAEFPQILRVIA